mmetsp:Transcript_19656/g.63082  ORF Transcript_19656/g.63082 Transcript_19656/m.63082 type:complete len:152 (+) Transcript_19656:347-802(+)
MTTTALGGRALSPSVEMYADHNTLGSASVAFCCAGRAAVQGGCQVSVREEPRSILVLLDMPLCVNLTSSCLSENCTLLLFLWTVSPTTARSFVPWRNNLLACLTACLSSPSSCLVANLAPETVSIKAMFEPPQQPQLSRATRIIGRAIRAK